MRYCASLHIQSECGKMRTRITPNTDSFYAVISFIFPLKSYQSTKTITWIFFQSKLHIFKLLIVLFIFLFDMQYWKWNKICNNWKIKENLNIFVWFTCFYRFIFIYFIFPTLSPRSSWASSVDFFLKFSLLPPYYIGREGACHKTSQNVSIKRLKLCVL